MPCDAQIFGICLQRAVGDTSQSIFGFAESIGALALLVIVYTIVGTQYQFRIYVAPGRLRSVTFMLIGIIGVGSLLKEVWIAEGWYVVRVPYMTQSVVEGLFGLAFLLVAMLWIFFAFIKPPRFSRWNYKRYAKRLVQIVIRGSDAELSDIAYELGRSADDIVKQYWKSATANLSKKKEVGKESRGRITIGGYANDLLLLLGNRKLCRHIVASSPTTAIAFFDSVSERKAYDVPLAQFAKNISTEAILNTDSLLYHEDDGFHSGLLGYIKRFSNAVYGDYALVESLGSKFGSPLDIDYRVVFSWNAGQLKAYTRAVLITFDDWLIRGYWRQHSYALHRAFGNVENSSHDVYKIEKAPEVDPDITERLRVVVDFIDKAIEAIEKHKDVAPKSMRPGKQRQNWDIYDRIAKMMSNVIFSVTSLTGPKFLTWDVQYGTVWSNFFGSFDDSKTRKIVLFKLRRMIFDEILYMDKFMNFKSARYIGICLNVMGVTIPKKGRKREMETALQIAVISWAKKNYLELRKENSDIADACLMGTISFDEMKKQLVKTYEKGLSKDAPQDRLQL